MSGSLATTAPEPVVIGRSDHSLVDLLDRLLAGGVVVRGQITLAAAGVDLVRIDLGLLLASIDTAARA